VTIALSVKINDGVVLATDSATSVIGQNPSGELGVFNVYQNANKLFNLRKGLPIGATTWGAGSIGNASIETLIKDLRERFSNTTDEWYLDGDNYSVATVAERVREFIFDQRYTPEFQSSRQKPALGFLIAGYSQPDGTMAEEYQIDIVNGKCDAPRLVRSAADSGLTWAGEPEALNRIIVGFSPGLPAVLAKFIPDREALSAAVAALGENLQVPMLFPAMPLQDAIDLAEFLVELSINFARFKPGAPTVGGPVEIAAISKHEGFRWIRRKYYFEKRFNPEERFTRVYESAPKP